MTTVTACGKVILFGEHAVVHGVPALAAAISPGATATVSTVADAGLVLAVSPWDAVFRAGDGSDLGRALGVLGDRLGVTHARVDLTLHLPGGGGLGSSAAMGVACARGLAALGGVELTEQALLDAALAWERVFHGNPSGVDHTLAALGGVGMFTRGEGLTRIQPRVPFSLVIADSGERAATKDMVASVARQLERRPGRVAQTFAAIETLVRNARVAIEYGDLKTVGDMMNLNQNLLASLMVSTERIEALCAAAREAGAYGAKLTGAGGGGCVVAIGPDVAALRAALAAVGAPTFVTEVAA